MIRKIRPEDAPAVIQMLEDFYTSDAVSTNGSPEIYAANVKNCLGDCPYVEGYVFCEGDTLQGYSMVATGYCTEFGKPCIWVEDLYIRPQFRGKGIATDYFSFLRETFPDRVIRLEAEPDNEKAIALYKRCGFGTLPYLQLIIK